MHIIKTTCACGQKWAINKKREQWRRDVMHDTFENSLTAFSCGFYK